MKEREGRDKRRRGRERKGSGVMKGKWEGGIGGEERDGRKGKRRKGGRLGKGWDREE